MFLRTFKVKTFDGQTIHAVKIEWTVAANTLDGAYRVSLTESRPSDRVGVSHDKIILTFLWVTSWWTSLSCTTERATGDLEKSPHHLNLLIDWL